MPSERPAVDFGFRIGFPPEASEQLATTLAKAGPGARVVIIPYLDEEGRFLARVRILDAKGFPVGADINDSFACPPLPPSFCGGGG